MAYRLTQAQGGSGWWTGGWRGLNVTPMDRRLDRRLVGLAAAYAVALNMLLPVLTLILLPGASSALGPAVICSGAARAESASDHGAPEKPGPLCPCPGPCAMAGCAATASPDAGVVLAAVAWLRVGPVGLGGDGGDTQTFRLDGRNFARGPPAA